MGEKREESRVFEIQAREELKKDGCPLCYPSLVETGLPPCYPSELEDGLQNVPERYKAIVSYWISQSHQHDVIFVHSYQTGVNFAYIKGRFDIIIDKDASANFWIRFASDEKSIISKIMFIFASMCVSKVC